jgi:gamma-glutamyltranspeptidase/glutathione hydrolase
MLNRLLKGLAPVALSVALFSATSLPARTPARHPAARHLPARHAAVAAAVAAKGMVSAADPRAAAAGREILNAGGTAADAAIATMLALTVVEPQSSGIGGGGFLVYHDARTGQIGTINGREKAPAAATPAYFLDAQGKPRAHSDAVPGGLSIGVPGNLRLAELAHRHHGKLAWATLFQPAIRLARDGFAMSPRMRDSLSSPNALARSTAFGRGYFYDASGNPKPLGTILRNPALAESLTQIARKGANWFYTGANAAALVATARNAPRNPGMITTADLAAYQAQERPAVCAPYRQYRICGMGPPSSGGLAVYAILKQLERFDMSALGPKNPTAWHLIADSMRLAYADRDAYVGDPDFVRVPLTGMTNAGYLASRSELIRTDRAIPHVEAGTPPGARAIAAVKSSEVPATTHFVVVDSAGDVASYTSTIEGGWGSGQTVGGYFLNNELTDFTFTPVLPNGAPVANRPEGGKRPMSSMSPTIVYGPDGKVRIAIGAAGGPTIIAQVAKALIAVLDWKMSAQAAIALPTIMGWGDQVSIERGTELEAMAPTLRAMGHEVIVRPPGFKANAIERVDGRWVGAADPRSEGVVISQ